MWLLYRIQCKIIPLDIHCKYSLGDFQPLKPKNPVKLSVEAIYFLFTAVCLNWLGFVYVLINALRKISCKSQSKLQLEFSPHQVYNVDEFFLGNLHSNLAQSAPLACEGKKSKQCCSTGLRGRRNNSGRTEHVTNYSIFNFIAILPSHR